jgi:oligoribonuclease
MSRIAAVKLLNPLVWIDLEMSGLNLKKDYILEIAVILTDGNLNNKIYGPEIIIKQDKSLLDSMDAWCTEHHAKSGLTEKVLKSEYSMEQAEKKVLDFITSHIPEYQAGVLAGNSIHVDRSFLLKDMPKIANHLHYRIVDVSSIKVLSQAWYPDLKYPRKKNVHRALEDIEESIEELQFYRKNVFKQY